MLTVLNLLKYAPLCSRGVWLGITLLCTFYSNEKYVGRLVQSALSTPDHPRTLQPFQREGGPAQPALGQWWWCQGSERIIQILNTFFWFSFPGAWARGEGFSQDREARVKARRGRKHRKRPMRRGRTNKDISTRFILTSRWGTLRTSWNTKKTCSSPSPSSSPASVHDQRPRRMALWGCKGGCISAEICDVQDSPDAESWRSGPWKLSERTF